MSLPKRTFSSHIWCILLKIAYILNKVKCIIHIWMFADLDRSLVSIFKCMFSRFVRSSLLYKLCNLSQIDMFCILGGIGDRKEYFYPHKNPLDTNWCICFHLKLNKTHLCMLNIRFLPLQNKYYMSLCKNRIGYLHHFQIYLLSILKYILIPPGIVFLCIFLRFKKYKCKHIFLYTLCIIKHFPPHINNKKRDNFYKFQLLLNMFTLDIPSHIHIYTIKSLFGKQYINFFKSQCILSNLNNIQDTGG